MLLSLHRVPTIATMHMETSWNEWTNDQMEKILSSTMHAAQAGLAAWREQLRNA